MKINNKVKKSLIIIIIISVILLMITLFNIFNIEDDNVKIEEINDNIFENVEIYEKEDIIIDDEFLEDEYVEDNEYTYENMYFSYMNTSYIDVDLTKLKEINSDTVGWIQVKGTKINYPIVQTSNNDYYINHAFDKTYNTAGWVFLDYRNKLDLSDSNTIIYGHSRLNETMFGSLYTLLSEAWISNKDNHLIKISTSYSNSVWQIFSVYVIDTTNDYLNISFTNKGFIEFAYLIKARSDVYFDDEISITSNDQVLTLSTCYNWPEDKRLVVHALLLKSSG